MFVGGSVGGSRLVEREKEREREREREGESSGGAVEVDQRALGTETAGRLGGTVINQRGTFRGWRGKYFVQRWRHRSLLTLKRL